MDLIERAKVRNRDCEDHAARRVLVQLAEMERFHVDCFHSSGPGFPGRVLARAMELLAEGYDPAADLPPGPRRPWDPDDAGDDLSPEELAGADG